MTDLNNVKTYQKFLVDKLKETEDKKLLAIYNEVLSKDYGYVFDNTNKEVLNSLFKSPAEAVRAVCYGHYEYSSPYARIEGDGNLASEYILKQDLPLEELAENIVYKDYEYFLHDHKDYLNKFGYDFYDFILKSNKDETINFLNLLKDKKAKAYEKDYTYKNFLEELEIYTRKHLFKDLDIKDAYDL